METTSVDDSDLGGITVCDATRILSLLWCSVTVQTSFVTVAFVERFLRSSAVM